MNVSPEFEKIKVSQLSNEMGVFANLYRSQKLDYNKYITEAKESPNMNVKERQAHIQDLANKLTETGNKLDNIMEQMIKLVDNSNDKNFNTNFKEEIAIIFLEFTNDFEETKETFLKNSEQIGRAAGDERINKTNEKENSVEDKDNVITTRQEAVAENPESYRSMIASSLYNGLLNAFSSVKDKIFSSNLPESKIKEEVSEEKGIVEENKIEEKVGVDNDVGNKKFNLQLLKKEDISLAEISENFSPDDIKEGFSERKKIYQPILDINEQIEMLNNKGFNVSKLRLNASPKQIAQIKAIIEKILNSPEYKNL